MISIVVISKDEVSLDDTLSDLVGQGEDFGEPFEIVVVDASDGRLDHIQRHHESAVRWIQFKQPVGISVSIPHQRNVGVQAAGGDIIVFTDAGCRPEPRWLRNIVAPLLKDEEVTVGLTLAAPGSSTLYDCGARQTMKSRYLKECSTINLAFRRDAYEAIGQFDEAFAYGSDVDFTWRLSDGGYRIRSVPEAVVRHDWGGRGRQLRRSYLYGKARMRLYRKHRARLRRVLRDDPIAVIYPAFILGLPLTVIFPFYPALLLIPAWRNRANGATRVLVDHLVYGAGVIAELALR